MVNGRVVTMGGVDYEVRPMAGVLHAYEVWRALDEFGYFTFDQDTGEVHACTLSSLEVDAVLIKLIAGEYVNPIRL